MMSPELSFIKMHGLGNDFVVLDNPSLSLTEALITFLAHRRTGVGCDQVLVLRPSADAHLHGVLEIYNADGSGAEACGNGTRCVMAYLAAKYGLETVHVQGPQGILEGVVHAPDDVSVVQGTPKVLTEDPLDLSDFSLEEGYGVSLGNPHLVTFVKEEKVQSLCRIGPRLEVHPFFPQKTNVEFVCIRDDKTIDLFVWERGAGRTTACASGACAAVAAGVEAGLLRAGTILVNLEGGPLWVTYTPGGKITQRGGVAKVFEGKTLCENYTP
jgi:diaminopimelate epimerase